MPYDQLLSHKAYTSINSVKLVPFVGYSQSMSTPSKPFSLQNEIVFWANWTREESLAAGSRKASGPLEAPPREINVIRSGFTLFRLLISLTDCGAAGYASSSRPTVSPGAVIPKA